MRHDCLPHRQRRQNPYGLVNRQRSHGLGRTVRVESPDTLSGPLQRLWHIQFGRHHLAKLLSGGAHGGDCTMDQRTEGYQRTASLLINASTSAMSRNFQPRGN